MVSVDDLPKKDGQTLIIIDNCIASNRQILFTSVELLTMMSKSKMWASDGNFKIHPWNFKQLYVIRFKLVKGDGLRGKGKKFAWVTGAFCLMSNKTTLEYERLFTQIRNLFVQYNIPNPEEMIWLMDFEAAAMSSAEQIFRAIIRCCLYHLNANLIK